MQPAKHGGVSLAVWSAIYGTSESFLKRASAAGVNVSNKAEVMAYLHEHGRESTKFAVAKGQAPAKILGSGVSASRGVEAISHATHSVAPPPPAPPKTKKLQPRAKTPEEARAILEARKEHFATHPEQAKTWPPDELRRWLTEV